MTAIGRKEITEHHFETRLRGYDTDAVDRFLQKLAGHVEWLQSELAGQATDRAALDLLKNAERIAHDTRLGAEIDANRERQTAASELEQARLAAAGLVEEGRAEAARIVSQANAHAAALRQQAQNVSAFITDSASDLRLGASRLTEMADQFDLELAKRREANQPGAAGETRPAGT